MSEVMGCGVKVLSEDVLKAGTILGLDRWVGVTLIKKDGRVFKIEGLAWATIAEGLINSLVLPEFEARVMRNEFEEINSYPAMESLLWHSKGFVLYSLGYLVLLKSKPRP